MALNHAATMTLCWHRKASHSRLMLLLVSSTADHGMILNHARRRASAIRVSTGGLAARPRKSLRKSDWPGFGKILAISQRDRKRPKRDIRKLPPTAH
jgi:hypothetical protein